MKEFYFIMAYIDVHCHIDMCKNEKKAIENAIEKNVKIIVTQGTDIETNRKAIELSEKYKEIRAALGIYPIDVLELSDEEIDDEIDFIRKNKEKITAIGEVGLDYMKDTENIEKQKKAFEKFIELAKELDKPIIVHSRKAETDCIEMLEKAKAEKVVMHCFSGKISLAKRIEKNGWFLSIPANVKNSEHFQTVVKEISINNLLCETDSPFLHPDKLENNEPCNVIESYKKIAEIKNLKIEEVEKKIESNYKKIIKLK